TRHHPRRPAGLRCQHLLQAPTDCLPMPRTRRSTSSGSATTAMTSGRNIDNAAKKGAKSAEVSNANTAGTRAIAQLLRPHRWNEIVQNGLHRRPRRQEEVSKIIHGRPIERTVLQCCTWSAWAFESCG